ncbi:hypothetical protein TNIN_401641 [Trichonephila inaurata madagascariensis]|uniref:Uncharacterized protein n=1 Tax=Trichonephila inaurata madagascariensis TaxID=2747483 RepID=A0A8X7CNJ5_9ARAC|nr:hypothetical protein TNIN_401641 [Trichonephila inaurata madagascariensis]
MQYIWGRIAAWYALSERNHKRHVSQVEKYAHFCSCNETLKLKKSDLDSIVSKSDHFTTVVSLFRLPLSKIETSLSVSPFGCQTSSTASFSVTWHRHLVNHLRKMRKSSGWKPKGYLSLFIKCRIESGSEWKDMVHMRVPCVTEWLTYIPSLAPLGLSLHRIRLPIGIFR